jgi:hypothetical protein
MVTTKTIATKAKRAIARAMLRPRLALAAVGDSFFGSLTG